MMQAGVPALAAYFPAAQRVQDTWPASLLVSEPASQFVQESVDAVL
jgi:hypothetical protein